MRLDKYIAHYTDLTRSQARTAIRRGRVKVDGIKCKEVAATLPPHNLVQLDDETVRSFGPRYFQLNKPAGFVCSTDDPVHPIALSLLKNEITLEGLHYAGRLDCDVTGLVLISDDGSWTHALSSPRKRCGKIYQVQTSADIPEFAVERFQQGMMLRGETRETLPAKLQIHSARAATVTLFEGRYHQVKRMFASIAAPVANLHRVSIGEILLDSGLKPGEYRALTEAEIASVTG